MKGASVSWGPVQKIQETQIVKRCLMVVNLDTAV